MLNLSCQCNQKTISPKTLGTSADLGGNPTGMGYAGYVPAKIAERKTSLQLALGAIQAEESLNVLSKLLRNTAVSPAGVHLNKQS